VIQSSDYAHLVKYIIRKDCVFRGRQAVRRRFAKL
jgi:hypothetical protein